MRDLTEAEWQTVEAAIPELFEQRGEVHILPILQEDGGKDRVLLFPGRGHAVTSGQAGVFDSGMVIEASDADVELTLNDLVYKF
jgi:hypothetical protein